MGHIVMRSRQTGCCTAATSPKLLNSRSSKCPRTSARGDEVRQEAQLEVVSRCFKVFPGIQPLKFATEFNGLQEKNLGLPAGLPTGPTSLCILPSSGDPRWKFLGIPNDGDMSWNDGTPQKIPMQNRNSFARKSNDGTPQVLISSFTTVSTILWQTPQKKKSWVWPSPYTTNHTYQPSITFTLHLGNQASGSPPCAGQSWPWWYLWIPEIISMTWVSWLSFCGKAIDLHLNFFQTQFLSSSPVSAPRTQAAGLSAQCRTTTRHPPRRSTRGRRACASCEAGWLPEIYPSSGVIHICYVYVYMNG